LSVKHSIPHPAVRPEKLTDRMEQVSLNSIRKVLPDSAILADGTCVSMADKPALAREFGVNAGYHGNGKYPLARLVTVCLANTMTVLAYAMGRYRDDETALLRPLLKTLQKGDLLVGDRHFAGANLYAEYQRAGLEFLTRAHQRLNVSRLRPITRYAQNDFTAYLKIGPTYRQKDPILPAEILVRFLQVVVRIRGKRQVIWLATSLLDAEAYPAAEPLWKLPEIYAEMLRQIAGHRVPERPGRNEPRAIRRETKHYPRLTVTRKLWRLKVA